MSSASPDSRPPYPPRRPRRVLGSSRSPAQPATHLTPHASHSPSTSDLSLSSTPSTTSPLLCPICSEEMLTLPQLNRHLDDAHPGEVEPLEKDDISSWFRKRVLKAKGFQPVAVLNQKLKGLDVFEPASAEVELEEERDPDYHVSRAHWTGGEACVHPRCRRGLGGLAGGVGVNCRCCGKRFCEEHTMYSMKLSRAAVHEPVRGYWCRVCRGCYEAREGYHDTAGVVRDHTPVFSEIRRRKLDRSFLEVTRLEKRLTKLTQLLLATPSSSRSARKALEQSVVSWAPDDSTAICPHCTQTFSALTLRKHHCRLCGRLVCGDARTLCSREIPLDIAGTSSVRICADDAHTLFSHRDFLRSLADPPPIVRAYNTLVSFQSVIGEMIPRFRRAVEDGRVDDAERAKRRIVEALGMVEETAKRIQGEEGRLGNAVAVAAGTWGRERMLEVKSWAAVLESGKQKRRKKPKAVAVKKKDGDDAGAVQERELREQMMVLEEQEFLLQGMMEDARKRRRLDEVAVLASNVQEIGSEIEKVRVLLEAVL